MVIVYASEACKKLNDGRSADKLFYTGSDVLIYKCYPIHPFEATIRKKMYFRQDCLQHDDQVSACARLRDLIDVLAFRLSAESYSMLKLTQRRLWIVAAHIATLWMGLNYARAIRSRKDLIWRKRVCSLTQR